MRLATPLNVASLGEPDTTGAAPNSAYSLIWSTASASSVSSTHVFSATPVSVSSWLAKLPAIAIPIGVPRILSVPRSCVTSRFAEPTQFEPVVSTVTPRSTFGVMRTVNEPESLAGFASALAAVAVISASAAVNIAVFTVFSFVFMFMSYLLASGLESHAGHGRRGHRERRLPVRRRRVRRARPQPQLARRRRRHPVHVRVLAAARGGQLVGVVRVARLVRL